MGILQIHAKCYDRFFEVFSDEVVDTELVIENAVSHVLLDLFDGVTMDEVSICFSSHLHTGLQHCFIWMQAQCAFQSFTLLPYTKERMDLAVENGICSILRELFGSVTVESITFSFSPWEHGSDQIVVSSVQ
jgi:hypothetical protein